MQLKFSEIRLSQQLSLFGPRAFSNDIQNIALVLKDHVTSTNRVYGDVSKLTNSVVSSFTIIRRKITRSYSTVGTVVSSKVSIVGKALIKPLP